MEGKVGKKKFSTELMPKTIKSLKKMCKKHRVSQNTLVEGALIREVGRLEKLKSVI